MILINIKNSILFIAILVILHACTPVAPAEVEEIDTTNNISKLTTDGSANLSQLKFSTDFTNWLNANGYAAQNFGTPNSVATSYGGKNTATDVITNHPVIFIHGNSDIAVGNTFGQTGWTNTINYFKTKGYTSAELYAVSWGYGNALLAGNTYHSKENIMRIRKFIEAVLAYTGATKVDIITHSMGVTLARKAIKGGTANDLLVGGNYNVGTPLTDKVDAFVGIAGANLGLTACYLTGGTTTPTCGATNGFFPGNFVLGNVVGMSNILTDLNSTSGYEGDNVYSIWSSVDEIVSGACLVYGKVTCRIPAQDGEKVYNAIPYGHFGLKDLTVATQYNMVKNHVVQ